MHDSTQYPRGFELVVGGEGTTLPQIPQHLAAESLPGVPVLAETLLRMELELHESGTDLRGFSDAVLGDVGATIQVLRLAGEEYGAATDRPVRIEDCISDLGPRACMQAVTRGSLLRNNRQLASPVVWSHSREVAQYFRLFASQTPEKTVPDQAYVAGLLHALGAIPAILGWPGLNLAGAPASVAVDLAEQWHFPHYLRDFFIEVLMPGHSPRWANFITVAHRPAKESWVDCPIVAARRYAYS